VGDVITYTGNVILGFLSLTIDPTFALIFLKFLIQLPEK